MKLLVIILTVAVFGLVLYLGYKQITEEKKDTGGGNTGGGYDKPDQGDPENERPENSDKLEGDK